MLFPVLPCLCYPNTIRDAAVFQPRGSPFAGDGVAWRWRLLTEWIRGRGGGKQSLSRLTLTDVALIIT
jgi:hypothetical protein